eukprot:GHVU01028132.1.p1 GENE.GHVU01028132.1~~GHVU01028132.1.p1  ORF type:complete len:301 (-),score=46.48 GHVU01028132.1:105-905(-)
MESALSCFGCMPPSRSKVDGAAAIKVPDLRRGVPPPGKQARLRTRSSTNGMPRALSPANNEPSAQPPLDFNIFQSIGSSMQSMTPSSAPGLDSWASSFGPLFGDDEGHGSVEEAAEGEGKQEVRDNAIQAEKEKWLKQKQQAMKSMKELEKSMESIGNEVRKCHEEIAATKFDLAQSNASNPDTKKKLQDDLQTQQDHLVKLQRKLSKAREEFSLHQDNISTSSDGLRKVKYTHAATFTRSSSSSNKNPNDGKNRLKASSFKNTKA